MAGRLVTRATLMLVLASVLMASGGRTVASGSRLVWIGTYTGPQSQGIYAFRFDDETGTLSPLGLAAETPSPSFLALHPNGKVLYAVNETHDGPGNSGTVTAFAIDPATGRLTKINEQPSRGADPCHLAVDATGQYLVVANYTGGNFVVFPLGEDGHLAAASSILANRGAGPNHERQDGPHAHDVVFDSANRFLIAVDLGLDQLFVYRFDPALGSFTFGDPPSARVPPGAGPRHFAFHPDGRHAYSINELDSTVTALEWDPSTGTLKADASVSTLPAGFTGENSTAEIEVDSRGRFLYGSNRGHDSIAVFRINPVSGSLTLIAHTLTRGKEPRHFALDSAGRWLVAGNQNSNTLAVFRVDQTGGTLSPVGDLVSVGSPVCILFAKQ
jgi:6-phosphogluconolactonase